MMKSLGDPEFTAFVGLDWANKKHDICCQAAGCEDREEKLRGLGAQIERRSA